MKFIGLFFILIAANGFNYGFSFSGLGILLIGLALTFSDVIFFWMKEEIKVKARRWY